MDYEDPDMKLPKAPTRSEAEAELTILREQVRRDVQAWGPYSVVDLSWRVFLLGFTVGVAFALVCVDLFR